jgi:hypothetical protein
MTQLEKASRRTDAYAGQPGLVLSAGPEGWWDSERVSCPAVIQEQDGTWKMWYYGRDATFDRDINMPTGRIGLAVSKDGAHWERVRGSGVMGAVLDPAPASIDRFDNGHVGVTHVCKENGLYWMWYMGGDQAVVKNAGLHNKDVKGYNMRPGCAVSRDGVNWIRLEGPFRGAFLQQDEQDPLILGWPRVYKEADGYRMYYGSLNPVKGGGVCLAISPDGLRWEKKGVVFSAKGSPGAFDERGGGIPSIVKVGGKYLMFYEAMSTKIYFCIGLAVSDDGIHWKKDDQGDEPGGPVFRHAPKGSGRFDAQAVGTPWVVPLADGSFRMYYVGCPEAGHDELTGMHFIGMAVSEGTDFRKWKRWGE